ncbi:MAG: hypothetical protein RR141_06845, partial [Rikenellaceae bacterium]
MIDVKLVAVSLFLAVNVTIGYSQNDKKVVNADSLSAVAIQEEIKQSEEALYRASQNKTIYAPDPISSPRALKQYERKLRRDSIRAKKKVWLSILGGPSYTPEASIGIGGALLASFRLSKNDSVSQRSFLPIGFNLSLNGTVVIAGGGTLFFNENRFRIY